MDVNALLTQDAPTPSTRTYNSTAIATTPHQEASAPAMTPKSMSPRMDCKTVHFVYCFNSGISAPKTLRINPHDATDSITSTVKSMFGLHLYDDAGVSFEDPSGMRMILRHENFIDDMTVYVRLEDNQSFMNHPYNLRQQQQQSLGYGAPFARSCAASLAYASGRSASPSVTRGRRIANGAMSNQNGCARSKSMKRQSSNQDVPMAQPYHDDHFQNGYYYQQQPPQFLLDEERDLDNRYPRASADISLDNIVEGSRRKRPKFSSDELPLFPPPPALRNDGSTASSASPPRATPQLVTPYANRSFAFPQPTTPSYYTNGAANGSMQGTSNSYAQSRSYGSGIIPTPAPTIASCISDEDVALQLMRLGEATTASGSATSSTLEDNYEEDRFSSECGDFGEDGRSDTTELPELPPAAPSSPIVYPRAHSKYKSLDEILPSFDSTEPSDDEYQPEPVHQFTYQPEQVHHTHMAGIMTEDEDDGDAFDDDADETYVGREDDDADYDEDLDDVPLKALRGRKQSSLEMSPVMTPKFKPQPQHPKGVVKATKRLPTILQTNAKPKPKNATEPNYPISPASPPASRKPSIASFTDHKSRSNTAPTTTLPTPTSLFNPQTATPIEEHHNHHEHSEVPAPKPRCQRCRKSKKGCDRQRPCQRCKDAGIPVEGCISEDEAGTRRGRLAAKNAAAAGAAKLKGKGKRKRV
ncbi:hypothetical protein RUND412_003063 [Rhizina undulata]